MSTTDPPSEFWEFHYASMDVDPDGSLPGPNAVLVDLARDLTPGTALDLGAGRGGDAFWLAGRGWTVTAVDVSSTALDRVVDRAHAAGLSDRLHPSRHDLSSSFPGGTFDLVNAQYFHSPVEMNRVAVLAGAAAAVNPGGMLLVVDHASVPPWSWAAPDTVFPRPQQTLDGIGLDPNRWTLAVVENRERVADGPDGQRANVIDTVIAVVRRGE